jgi:hypothetical protein
MSALQQPPDGGDNDGFSRPLMTDRLIRGTVAKWNDQKGWHDRDGLPLPSSMFVVGVNTALQRWQNHQADTILHKPLPDAKALNATIPMTDWELDLNGKPKPPWELTYATYMIDLATGTAYTFVNSTTGARICFEQLQESVAIMRALRGSKVLPLVRLEQRPMKTSFGMRSRPHLQIIDWRTPGGDGGARLSTQSPTPQLTAPAAPTAAPTPTVAPPVAPAPPTTPPTAPPAAPPAASTMAPAAAATLNATVKPIPAEEFIKDSLPSWA